VNLILDREQIREAVYRAIERARQLSLDETGLANEESTVLFGEGAALDSMGVVNFVVALEDELSNTSEQQLNLVDVLSSPAAQAKRISTVGELIDFLYRLNAE
jgi:acyl carrier protein